MICPSFIYRWSGIFWRCLLPGMKSIIPAARNRTPVSSTKLNDPSKWEFLCSWFTIDHGKNKSSNPILLSLVRCTKAEMILCNCVERSWGFRERLRSLMNFFCFMERFMFSPREFKSKLTHCYIATQFISILLTTAYIKQL